MQQFYVNSDTFDEFWKLLAEILKWTLFRVQRGLSLLIIDDIGLVIQKVASYLDSGKPK